MAVKKKSIDVNTKRNISIVNSVANLVAFVPMDGAWLGSLDISLKKVKTAQSYSMNTGCNRRTIPIRKSNIHYRTFITFPRDVSIKNEKDEIIGAIGVSSSTVENNPAIAETAAIAL
ncbi:heme-binding protein [Aquimarina sp. RZ0]|nr:heme-binding protein [Aquimarina sp. RZ0]